MKERKTFLLVIHGGMVLYLLVHNIFIPLIRNIGQGNSLFIDVHYWFILHIAVFYFLYSHIKSNKNEGKLAWLLICGFWGILFKFTFAKFYSKTQIIPFSVGLETLSYIVFYSILGVYFKNLIKWKKHLRFSVLSSSLFVSFVLNAGLATIEKWPEDKTVAMIPQKENATRKIIWGGCEKKKVVMNLHRASVNDEKIEIISCGLEKNSYSLSAAHPLLVVNKTARAVHLRLYKLDETLKWKQKQFSIIPAQQEFQFLKNTEKQNGIYMLISKARKEVGYSILIKGQESALKGRYIFSPEGAKEMVNGEF